VEESKRFKETMARDNGNGWQWLILWQEISLRPFCWVCVAVVGDHSVLRFIVIMIRRVSVANLSVLFLVLPLFHEHGLDQNVAKHPMKDIN
jgi:hypothetical protein